MDDLITGKEAFDIADRYLGWGDRAASLWFIGLEGTNEWDQSQLRKYGDDQIDINSWIDDESSEKASEQIAKASKGVTQYSAKIARAVSREYRERGWDSWRDYRNARLWRRNAGVLHLNFQPLDRRSKTAWPRSFDEIFGFKTRREYQAALNESNRLQRIRDLRCRHNPQAIVCFGSDEVWRYAETAFQLGDNFVSYEADRVRVYSDDKVILTPFFGRSGRERPMTNQCARVAGERLFEWGVSIP